MKSNHTDNSPEQSSMASEPAAMMYATNRHAPRNRHAQNRVYIEDGAVKVEIETETMEPEELRTLLHKMVDLEYSLP